MGIRERFYLWVCRVCFDTRAHRKAAEWCAENDSPYPWTPLGKLRNWIVWQASIRAIRIQNELLKPKEDDRGR